MNFRSWSPLSSLSDAILEETRLVHVLDRDAFLVTNEDEVLVCGPKDYSSWGEDSAPRFSPESVVELSGKRVKAFVFGGYFDEKTFVVAHCFTGAVYIWGMDHGTDGLGSISKPTLMDQLTKKVVEVACGLEHCLLVNVDGEIFSWGGNDCGQLGINSKNRTSEPTKIVASLAGQFVEKISCGGSFSVAVLDSGKVFTWGRNDLYQLGLNVPEKEILIPTEVSRLNGIIKKISCGRDHVLAMNDVCELYVWGFNFSGELGLGDQECRSIPVKNEAVGRVANIAACAQSNTSAALTENLKVLMWGGCGGLDLLEPKDTLYESLHEVFAHFSDPCVTYKSMKRKSGCKSMDETMRNAFEDKETSDLTVVAEGKEIFVHRAVLRLRSDYFRVLLKEHWFNETDKSITIDQSYNTMYAYLKYLYCGELKAEPKLALELFELANEYNDRVLKRLCEKAIQQGITIDNVASLYAIALKLDGKKFLKHCFSFAANHMSELVDTAGFDEWDVHTMKEFFRECRKRKLFRF